MEEPGCLLPQRLMHPIGLEEESRMPSPLPCRDLVRISADRRVGGEDYSVRLASERIEPFHIRRIRLEPFLEMSGRMSRIEETVKRAGNSRWEVVIEKEPHAASPCSNSMASRTDGTSISYQSAISAIVCPALAAA